MLDTVPRNKKYTNTIKQHTCLLQEFGDDLVGHIVRNVEDSNVRALGSENHESGLSLYLSDLDIRAVFVGVVEGLLDLDWGVVSIMRHLFVRLALQGDLPNRKKKLSQSNESYAASSSDMELTEELESDDESESLELELEELELELLELEDEEVELESELEELELQC